MEPKEVLGFSKMFPTTIAGRGWVTTSMQELSAREGDELYSFI